MIRLNVKEIAAKKGISQGKLTRLTDMDVKTLKSMYRHLTSEMSTGTLDTLAKALEVDASVLIESVADSAQAQR